MSYILKSSVYILVLIFFFFVINSKRSICIATSASIGRTSILPSTTSMSVLTSSQLTMRLVSYNIRYDASDDISVLWRDRKSKVSNIIRNINADIIGLQEALLNQIEDIIHDLPMYSWYGVGRHGQNEGEFVPIMWLTSRYSLLNTGTFWLSSTPEIVNSKGWDAALPRIVSWVMLQCLHSNRPVYIFNTHFDHEGRLARAASARLILQKAKELSNNAPYIIMGDLNTEPREEPYQIFRSGDVIDANVSTTVATFTGFRHQFSKIIDYIFLSKLQQREWFHSFSYEIVVEEKNDPPPLASDHRPVVVTITNID